MFNDLLDKLGGDAAKLDPRKLLDLIDDLWESRSKIVDTVEFVWDRRDAIGEAIDFVQDHADDLVDLAKRLPELLGDAGGALETAGGGAVKASAMLLGTDGDGVGDLAAEAAAALDRCRDELHEVMGLFDKAGSGLASLPLVGSAAEPLVDGAHRIGAVAEDLGSVAGRLKGLGDTITDAGGDLGEVGAALGSSGVALQRLAPEPTRPPAKKSPKKRPAKRAAKKARKPAKKAAKRRTTKKPTPRKRATKATKRRKATTKKPAAKAVARKPRSTKS